MVKALPAILKLSALRPSAWRYSDPSPQQTRKLIESVRRFGQIRPAVVRLTSSGHEVIDGHRLVECFTELGLGQIWCIVLDPCDDVEAIRLMLVLNESRATIDHVALARLFKHVLASLGPDELASMIDFTPEQVQGYKDLLEFDIEGFANRGRDTSQVALGFEESAETPEVGEGDLR